ARLLPRRVHVAGDLPRPLLLGSGRPGRARQSTRDLLAPHRDGLPLRTPLPPAAFRRLRVRSVISPELGFILVFIGIVTLPFIVVTLVVSAIRHTPIENAVRAIGWLIVVLIAAAAAGSAVEPSLAGFATYAAGAVVTYALATRDRASHLIRVLGVDEDRRVHVPVSEMSVEDDRDTELGADLARAPDGAWDLGERDGHVLAGEDPMLAGMRER